MSKWTKETDLQVDCFGNRWTEVQCDLVAQLRALGLLGPLAAQDGGRGYPFHSIVHVAGYDRVEWIWVNIELAVRDPHRGFDQNIALDELILMSIAAYGDTDDWSLT